MAEYWWVGKVMPELTRDQWFLVAFYFCCNLVWAWSEFKNGSRNWADLILFTFFGLPIALLFIGRMTWIGISRWIILKSFS